MYYAILYRYRYRGERISGARWARGTSASSQSAAALPNRRTRDLHVQPTARTQPVHHWNQTEDLLFHVAKFMNDVHLHVPILPVVFSRDLPSVSYAGRVSRERRESKVANGIGVRAQARSDDRYFALLRAATTRRYQARVAGTQGSRGCRRCSRWSRRCVMRGGWPASGVMSAAAPEVRGPPADAASPPVALPRIKPELGLNDATLFAVYCFIKNFIGWVFFLSVG